MENQTKTCTCCGVSKPLDAFYDLKGGKYGKHSTCSICVKQKANARYYDDPEFKQRMRSNALNRYYKNKA